MAVVRCPKCGERIFGGGRKCPDCGYERRLADEVVGYLGCEIRSRRAMITTTVSGVALNPRPDLWNKKEAK